MNQKRSIWATRLFLLALVAVLMFGVTGTAYASDIREGDVVIIGEDEVIDDDLIVGGQRVEIYGTITGDAVLAGQTVIMNGTVEGSLAIGAQVAEVNGEVAGSMYIGAQQVEIGEDAVVGRNFYFGGLSVELEPGSSISRSAYLAGYQAALNGDVTDDVYVGLGSLLVSGSVGGNLIGTVTVDETDDGEWVGFFPGMVPLQETGLRIDDAAEIVGDNLLRLEEVVRDVPTPDLPDQISIEPDRVARSFAANRIRQRTGDFLGLLLVGMLLLAVLPGSIQRMRGFVETKPFPSLGWGLLAIVLFFVLLPAVIGVLILAAIIGGLVSLGTLVPEILGLGGAALFAVFTVFSFVMSIVSKVVVAYLIGRLILVRMKQSVETFWMKVGALALGLVLYELVRAIPLGIGWVVGMLVTWIGVGAAVFLVREFLSREEMAEVPADTEA